MPRGSAPFPLPVASSWPPGEALGSAMSAISEARLETMMVNIKREGVNVCIRPNSVWMLICLD